MNHNIFDTVLCLLPSVRDVSTVRCDKVRFAGNKEEVLSLKKIHICLSVRALTVTHCCSERLEKKLYEK